MTEPRAGLMACHNGTPVEFLWLIKDDRDKDGEQSWLVRPLFVDQTQNRVDVFRKGDRLTPLHCKFA